jgi:GTP cyclohydrolase II
MTSQLIKNSHLVPLDDDLVKVLSDMIHTIEEDNPSQLGILQACKILLDLVEEATNTQQRIYLKTIFDVCNNLKPFLSQEEQIAVTPNIEEAIKKLQSLVRDKRNPNKPLLPHRILPFATHRYNNGFWYVASFLFDDPEVSGTTDETHLAYIRTPEPIIQDGEDFNLDFFYLKNYWGAEPILIRIHSECMLGDQVIGQSRCDCGEQFAQAMDKIHQAGVGVLLYLRQEGRGIGLKKKLEAIEHYGGRKKGKWTGVYLNTEENMLVEGHQQADLRDYRFVGRILRGLGIEKVNIITNNPRKVQTLRQLGFEVEQSHAAGVAISTENLCEFLWKILSGYNVPFESIEKIHQEVELLKQGQVVDPILYKLLGEVYNHVKKKPTTHTVPTQLVKLLEGIADKLNSNVRVLQKNQIRLIPKSTTTSPPQ